MKPSKHPGGTAPVKERSVESWTSSKLEKLVHILINGQEQDACNVKNLVGEDSDLGKANCWNFLVLGLIPYLLSIIII